MIIRCDVPYPLIPIACTEPFLTENDNYDVLFRFYRVENIDLDLDGTWFEDSYYTSEATFFCPMRHCPPYAKVYWADITHRNLICDYVGGSEDLILSTLNLLNLLELENFFRYFQGLIFHSSFVSYQNSGILFCAPSGTGKSTQAELWSKYEGADILNGDRALVRKIQDTWTAFGLPVAGSSGIYRNESAPVKALVLLRQGQVNSIRRVSPFEALRFIYPEVTIHRWDSDFVNTSLNLLLDLLGSIGVYCLECRPDQDAVSLLKHTLFPGGDRL